MMVNPKRNLILNAAYTQFSQYGYRKTSMEDIAKGLGISRASLYSYFNNKDEIFCNVSQMLHDRALAEAGEWLQGQHSKEDLLSRLTAALLARHGPFHDAVVTSAHGAELFDEYGRLCRDIVFDSHTQFQHMLATMLKSADRLGEIDLKEAKLSVSDAAELLNLSAARLKRGADKPVTFRDRIGNFAAVFLVGLGYSR